MTTREKRPTAATWKLDRSKPLEETVREETVREATALVVKVYAEALRKLK